MFVVDRKTKNFFVSTLLICLFEAVKFIFEQFDINWIVVVKSTARKSDRREVDSLIKRNIVEATRTHQLKKMPSTSSAIDKLCNQFDNEVNNGDVVPIFKRALLYGDKLAIKDYNGKYSYRQILDSARKLSTKLSVYNNSEYANAHD